MTRLRRRSASVLAVVLLASIAAAYANPADTFWVPGVYDGGDYDDTALAVTSPAAPLDGPPPLPKSPSPASMSVRGASAPYPTPSSYARTWLDVRAPPFA